MCFFYPRDIAILECPTAVTNILSLSRYTEGVSNMFVHPLTPSELGDTAPNVKYSGVPQREISRFTAVSKSGAMPILLEKSI